MRISLAFMSCVILGTTACAFDPSGLPGGDNQPQSDASVDDQDGGPDATPGLDASMPDALLPVPDAGPVPACVTSANYTDVEPTTGHRYRVFVNRTESWNTAATVCAGEEAHLIVIDSQVENDFVRGLRGTDDRWIGLHDMNTEDSYEWITGAPVVFTSWHPDEPNDQSTEDCAEMRGDGLWNDIDCGTQRGFMCECDPLYVP